MKKFQLEDIKQLFKKYSPPTHIASQTRSKDGVDGRIVSYLEKQSHIAEQYKVLRTNLYSLSPENPIKTVVITSAQAREGKTITSCNLAVTLAMDKEKKILLIDADLRKPAVHSLFGLPVEPGFSDILIGNADLESFIKKPAVGDLFVIPAGSIKENPSEILSLAKIENLIDRLKSKFDYIIFDTPPVLDFTDASILGSRCDAVIPVIKAGATQQSVIEEAFHLLTEAQAKPRACILTCSHFLLDSHYYFYKYKEIPREK